MGIAESEIPVYRETVSPVRERVRQRRRKLTRGVNEVLRRTNKNKITVKIIQELRGPTEVRLQDVECFTRFTNVF